MSFRDQLRHFRPHASACLLGAQLLGLLIYPFMEGRSGGRLAFETFGILVLCLAVAVVRQSPVPTPLIIGLGLFAAGFAIVGTQLDEPWVAGVSAAFHAVFYFVAAISLIAYMVRDLVVTKDDLFAIGATFTLVAWAFAYVFLLVQAVQPGSFTAAVDADQPRTWTEMLFLSFTTLSSTGLSDIIPITPFARGVVMFEQLAGLAYLAGLTSYLVGLSMQRISRRTPKDPPEQNGGE